MDAKERAARAALEHVASGMTIGLGTGSTAKVFIDLLGREIAAGRLANIRGVPTSIRSYDQARNLSIEIVDLAAAGECDVTIDGADEVDDKLDLIKGLGGALLREKVIAQNSRKLVIIADSTKKSPHLGQRSPLPVEVVPFSHEATAHYLRTLGGTATLRVGEGDKPYVTDNGNYIYDCRYGPITQAADLNTRLKSRAGIVETGLFI
ncbi:MAG TPA: ribose 5-phosphate isomerase A, partial [Tepidisphaeraceae bacterium]